MKYLLDTNIISALIKGEVRVWAQLASHWDDGVYLCPPVYYEVIRGLVWKKASSKILSLKELRGRLGWLQIVNEDWLRAGELWANAVSHGKQLADIDLLISAIALRHDATVVTADDDFDALPVKRENWRDS